MHYNKLLKRYKLRKFWIFWGSNLKLVFKANFKNLSCIYKLDFFLELKSIMYNFKKIIPLIINISKINNNVLFIFNKSLYSQTILKKSYSNCKQLSLKKLGLFTNFSFICYNALWLPDSKVIPCFLVCFFLKGTNNLLIEGKKKKIPTLGLLSLDSNSNLIDYPIFFNFFYFYSIYFFNKIFLILLLLHK